MADMVKGSHGVMIIPSFYKGAIGLKGSYGDTVKLGADVSVAAGPLGRSAGAATDANLKASIYSYSISKGLFAGVSLGGAVTCSFRKGGSKIVR